MGRAVWCGFAMLESCGKGGFAADEVWRGWSEGDGAVGGLGLRQKGLAALQEPGHLLGTAADVAPGIHESLQLRTGQAEGRVAGPAGRRDVPPSCGPWRP